MRKPPPPHLRLVDQPPEQVNTESSPALGGWQQGALLAYHQEALLILVDFDAVTEADFLQLVLNARPQFVIDLRVAPRFDVGLLNRRNVFALFEQISAKYIDLPGRLGVQKGRDARLNPALLAKEVGRDILGPGASGGPLVFLGDSAQLTPEYGRALAQGLSSRKGVEWDVLRVPHHSQAAPDPHVRRDTIFISHATPEDSEFARWLGSQLALSGYKVWSDCTGLIGGEEFWSDIEAIIRNRAAKFVVGISRTSYAKKGVIDEIYLATSVESHKQLSEFVIPLKLDDFPFDEFRVNILAKNAVDFSRNWAHGLSRLLSVLERDGVPRSGNGAKEFLAQRMQRRIRKEIGLIKRPEPVLLNWVEVLGLPTDISFFELGASSGKIAAITKTLPLPHFKIGNLLGTFADAHELTDALPGGVRARLAQSSATSDFISGGAPLGIRSGEARKQLSSLLRQAWDTKARSIGLLPYDIASGARTWFPAHGQLQGDQTSFTDQSGVLRRKKLVGYSAKRKVFWHFALEMRPAWGEPLRFIAKPHVVFSLDGRSPLDSASKMHALRRGFCRSWWNDRWRDLTIAYLSYVSGGEETIELPVGSGRPIVIRGALWRVRSPVTAGEIDLTVDETDEALDVDLEDEELHFVGPLDNPRDPQPHRPDE